MEEKNNNQNTNSYNNVEGANFTMKESAEPAQEQTNVNVSSDGRYSYTPHTIEYVNPNSAGSSQSNSTQNNSTQNNSTQNNARPYVEYTGASQQTQQRTQQSADSYHAGQQTGTASSGQQTAQNFSGQQAGPNPSAQRSYQSTGYEYQSVNNAGGNSYMGSAGYQYQNHVSNQNAAPKKKGKGKKYACFIGKAVAFGAIAGCVMIGMTFTFNHINGNKSTGRNTVATTTSVKSSSVKSASQGNVSSVVDSVMPSIVSITSTFESSGNNMNDIYQWFYGGGGSTSQEQVGSGSGIIISETDDQLMVVTNNHVISDSSYGDAKKVQVTFSDEKQVDATIKGTDSDADLAVLVINKSDVPQETMDNIKIAVIGDSDSMKVGDEVIAIGNALGYGQSVTTGVVSALNREVQLTDKTMTLLQTDAAINPGNSGGALLNMNGEVIGINTVKYSSDEVEGMGYAIPMQIGQPIIDELMNEEKVPDSEQAYLGIYGDKVDSQMTSAYDMPEGVWVSSVVDNSPAAQAGIQQRDIIVKFNEHTISSMESLQEQISKKKAGTEVTITVKRQNDKGEYKDVELKVTLGKKSDAPSTGQNDNQQRENRQQDNSNDQSGDNGWFFNR